MIEAESALLAISLEDFEFKLPPTSHPPKPRRKTNLPNTPGIALRHFFKSEQGRFFCFVYFHLSSQLATINLIPGTSFKDYFWRISGDHMWYWGSKLDGPHKRQGPSIAVLLFCLKKNNWGSMFLDEEMG